MTPSRRRFLHHGAAGLATLGLMGQARAAQNAPATRPATTPGGGAASGVVPLVAGWTFAGKIGDDSAQPVTVTLPHCVTELSWAGWEPADWEHRWQYRKTFDRPAAPAGGRVFLEFDGVMTGCAPTLNGQSLPEHLGGYLPFSYEITDLLRDGENELEVVVDGRWLDVPPNGAEGGAHRVDYLQPAGIYREVRLRVVPETFVADVFAKPVDVLGDGRRLDVRCAVDNAAALADDAELVVELRDGDRTIARQTKGVGKGEATLTLSDLGQVELWDLDSPKLYDVVTTLRAAGRAVHEHRARVGFREARFENDGFYLNGRHLNLFGVNRHQTFPYAGMAMPRRAQRKDAELLKRELNCNAVRCSHYPQSEHFLDACDELGMLVFEEIPGWQYLGDKAWRELAVRDVEVMIRRGRNRPSIVTWGVRINESRNAPALYKRTLALARELDDSRPTHGAMVGGLHSIDGYFQDVFTYNDYQHTEDGAFLRPPLAGIPYIVTEAVGSLSGPHFYRRVDPMSVQQRQAELHAQVHHQAAGDRRHLGMIAWSGIDYQSKTGFVDNHMKRNGVLDTFRVPKPGAAIYQSQCDPKVRPVIQPAFYWDFGDVLRRDNPGKHAMICSNCDRLELHVGNRRRSQTALPDVQRFGHLRYPPTFAELDPDFNDNPELRIEGYVGDEKVIERTFSSDRSADELAVTADDDRIAADGIDATRVVFRVVDKYGNPRPYVRGDVTLALDGPGELIGESPFAFEANGGVGAVWLRGRAGEPGELRLAVDHPQFGARTATVRTAS